MQAALIILPALAIGTLACFVVYAMQACHKEHQQQLEREHPGPSGACPTRITVHGKPRAGLRG